jgi:hypothetical protein
MSSWPVNRKHAAPAWRLDCGVRGVGVPGVLCFATQAKLVVIAQEQQAAEIREIRGDVVKVPTVKRSASADQQGTCLLHLHAEPEAWTPRSPQCA